MTADDPATADLARALRNCLGEQLPGQTPYEIGLTLVTDPAVQAALNAIRAQAAAEALEDVAEFIDGKAMNDDETAAFLRARAATYREETK